MTVNTVRALLENAAASAPHRVALIHDSARLSFRELLERVNRVANYLNTRNLPRGSRIGIYSRKGIDQVIAILSILSTGHIAVPITRLLKPEQVRYIIDDCGIETIITGEQKIETFRAIEFQGEIISYEASPHSHVAFEEIYKCHSDKLDCDIKGHDNAAITYSFSTVGNPKGIVIDHRALVDGARIVSAYLELGSDDVLSGILSFNVDYGLNQIFAALYTRATLAIHRFVLPGEFFDHLIRDRVTILPLMPIHISEMFDEEPHRIPKPEHFDSLRAVTSSGGNLTPRMITQLQTHFPGAQIFSMHGLTEAFRSAYLDPAQINIRPGSIGKAVPDVELYIIDEEGNACAPRQVGELIHRGACIYKGFWNTPEETARRFKSIKILDKIIHPEGRLTDEIVVASGDYVYADEEGYIYFVGRKDDMIKTRGYRVSPYEIESVVREHLPRISECAVFSLPNDAIEEEIVLVYNAPAELSESEILFELKQHLANYMLPEQIHYHPNMPRKSLHSQEIDKEALRNMYLGESG